jgi:hypothetical protein
MGVELIASLLSILLTAEQPLPAVQAAVANHPTESEPHPHPYS